MTMPHRWCERVAVPWKYIENAMKLKELQFELLLSLLHASRFFTLINSLPNYDSFNSIPSHCFRVLEHWLQSYYFGLQSRLSVLWSVHQVSPLQRQEQGYFSVHWYTEDVLKEDHKQSSIIEDVLLNQCFWFWWLGKLCSILQHVLSWGQKMYSPWLQFPFRLLNLYHVSKFGVFKPGFC